MFAHLTFIFAVRSTTFFSFYIDDAVLENDLDVQYLPASAIIIETAMGKTRIQMPKRTETRPILVHMQVYILRIVARIYIAFSMTRNISRGEPYWLAISLWLFAGRAVSKKPQKRFNHLRQDTLFRRVPSYIYIYTRAIVVVIRMEDLPHFKLYGMLHHQRSLTTFKLVFETYFSFLFV